MKKVILTTGGTGGHIYPALAVADTLYSKGIEVLFIGSIQRMEKDLVSKTPYRFIGLNIKVPRNLKAIFTYLKAIKNAYKIIKKENPDAIIGFGNYISVPTVLAGILQRKKVYLQEQNANIGYANKLFYRFAALSFLAFEKTYDNIALKYQYKFKVTGNPLRYGIESLKYIDERKALDIKPNERMLLITGGSLGAQDINEAVVKKWEKLSDDETLKIYWATGKDNFDKIKGKITINEKRHVIKPYFENMLNIMAASDLVICRAGALTISEVIELERPAVLIPYGSVKVGQYENAKILLENDSALVYTKETIDEGIDSAFELIKNDERLRKMRIKVKALKKSNAAEEIIANLDIWRN